MLLVLDTSRFAERGPTTVRCSSLVRIALRNNAASPPNRRHADVGIDEDDLLWLVYPPLISFLNLSRNLSARICDLRIVSTRCL